MKYCVASVFFFCSVSGSRSLKDVDDYATTDGFTEALRRQLKVMPPCATQCTCPDGYTERNGSCFRSVDTDPQEVCRQGKMVDDLCVTPAPSILQCPEEHITICREKDRAESPCCAKTETADRVSRCREGAKSQQGHCVRTLSHPLVNYCPAEYALNAGGTECIKQEFGKASPLCVAPDVLSPEGDSCLTTVQEGFQYICPDGYECVAQSMKKSKTFSPICSACAKTEETQPDCRCPEDQEEVDGFCYEAGTSAACQSRLTVPLKQAQLKKKGVPAKERGKGSEVVNCKPLGRISCTCNHPYKLQCDGNNCTCIHTETIPPTPICKGYTDADGNCLSQVQKRLLYECAEGFTCDVVDKKGRCHCVRITSVAPVQRCAAGTHEDGKCLEVVKEPQIVECPSGHTETCCDSICTCTKTTLAVRDIKCAVGAVSIQGECVYVSKPSAGCAEGLLRGEKCIQEHMAPRICGK